jgi:hypothetical protein
VYVCIVVCCFFVLLCFCVFDCSVCVDALLLFDVCCLLFVVCCLLFVVCCLRMVCCVCDCLCGMCCPHFLVSIVVSIPACHAGDPGSIPGRGVPLLLLLFANHLFSLASFPSGNVDAHQMDGTYAISTTDPARSCPHDSVFAVKVSTNVLGMSRATTWSDRCELYGMDAESVRHARWTHCSTGVW